MVEFCVVCALVLGAVVAVTGASKAEKRTGALKYLALGDSYTIGESVPEAERWPVLLAGQLRDAGLAVAEPDGDLCDALAQRPRAGCLMLG